jgi:hypothetical protein
VVPPALRTCALAGFLVAATFAGAARAAGCPGDMGPLAAVPVEARVAFLRARLEANRTPAARWTATWGIVDGALVAGQLVAIPYTSDPSTRALLVAGAASGSLVLVQFIFFPVVAPPPPAVAGEESSCDALRELERTLERGARNQAVGAGPGAHVGNTLINAGLGVGTGFASNSVAAGVFTFAVGFALGEAQILTQPTELVRDWDRYLEANLTRPEKTAIAPIVRLGPGRAVVVGLGGTF